MKIFKISCHAISEIMSGEIGLTEAQKVRLSELIVRKRDHAAGVDKIKPLTANMEDELKDLIIKRDNPQLPAGAKTYLKKWMKKKLFNRKEDWKALVVEKGLACEPMGIELIDRVYGLGGLIKNDEWFENEYLHGIPDIIHDLVRDVKCSWDLDTFPMFDDPSVLPNKDYWWQLQGYMILTGIKKACIDYVLIDTPLPLVQLDLRKLYFQSGGRAEDWTPDTNAELMPNYRFDDIPEKLRVKTFEVEFDPTVEAKINQRVIMCRKYIAEILELEKEKLAEILKAA